VLHLVELLLFILKPMCYSGTGVLYHPRMAVLYYNHNFINLYDTVKLTILRLKLENCTQFLSLLDSRYNCNMHWLLIKLIKMSNINSSHRVHSHCMLWYFFVRVFDFRKESSTFC